MEQKIVQAWEENKELIRNWFANNHPDTYKDLVKTVIDYIGDSVGMNSGLIHQIDDGDYQGTLVFVIAANGYQPSNYWYVKIGYGSCSVCDTLEGIREYSNQKPTEQQVNDYMTLALHIVQAIKPMSEDIV